ADGVLGGMPAGAEPTARARATPRSTAGDPHRAVRARRQSRRSARATRAGPEAEEATVTERTAVFSPWCAWVRRASRPRPGAPGAMPGSGGSAAPAVLRTDVSESYGVCGGQTVKKFVTLEFTFVLNAEAAMPTSPEASRPSALRPPWKSNCGPTCPSGGLLGAVGVTCPNTWAPRVS